ncbi:Late embryogenesis abundant (LEA) hydroxyproline-rich glycoprotein family [Forsythia ovata]|uniref:Late embryogenesis abundant (LEA) hydroxyproline-rich glycoprotein family n=1 Tax=Forsythia ovata TaxID=205694 RepID=A0ABD1X7C9_9LAMI
MANKSEWIAAIESIIRRPIFKPKEPNITVIAVQVPSFSASNSTVNFTFSQYATINNPNQAVFTHYNSSLQLLYAGTQVGFMFIPAGKIDAGQTEYMSATFSVQSFPLSVNKPESMVARPTVTEGFNEFQIGPSIEIESRLEMSGRVRFLHFFTHHVDASAEYRVSYAPLPQSLCLYHSRIIQVLL